MNHTVLCPCCRIALVPRANPRGGTFLGCPNLAKSGCEVSYSVQQQRFWKVPGTVARASSAHGRATSVRARTLHALVQQGITPREAEAFINDCGLTEVAALAGL